MTPTTAALDDRHPISPLPVLLADGPLDSELIEATMIHVLEVERIRSAMQRAQELTADAADTLEAAAAR